MGQVILNQKVSAQSISILEIENRFYFIEIQTEKGIRSERLVVER
jgi:hypothetical protein